MVTSREDTQKQKLQNIFLRARHLLNSPLKLVRGDLVEMVKLDRGVSLPTTELCLAGELGDSLNSSLELVRDKQDLQKSPQIFHGFLCNPNILS